MEKIKSSKHEEELKEANEDEENEDDEPAPKNRPATDEEIRKEMEGLTGQMFGMKISPSIPESLEFNYDKLVNGLKNGEFKKICILSGAGISVSAGIPDFRSPKTGIYANLAKYNIPQPEALFAIDFFN